jgi:hypothetical protein
MKIPDLEGDVVSVVGGVMIVVEGDSDDDDDDDVDVVVVVVVGKNQLSSTLFCFSVES